MKSSIKLKRKKHIILLYANKFMLFKRFLKPVLLGGLVIFSISFLSSKTEIVTVKKIDVVGTKAFVSKKDLVAILSSLVIGKNIFKIESNNLEQLILDNFQGAKGVKVTKLLPGTVKVVVEERVPLAVIHSQDNYYLTDEDGYILGIIDKQTTNLPLIEYKGDVKVGFSINKELIPVYLDLLNSISENNLKTSSISADSRNVTFYLDKHVKVFLSTGKDINRAIFTLTKLYNQLISDGKVPRRIDLRYDKVIVSYE